MKIEIPDTLKPKEEPKPATAAERREMNAQQSEERNKERFEAAKTYVKESWIGEKVEYLKAGVWEKLKTVVSEGKENILTAWHERGNEKRKEKEALLLGDRSAAAEAHEKEMRRHHEKLAKWSDTPLQDILKGRMSEKTKEHGQKVGEIEAKLKETKEKTKESEGKIKGYQERVSKIREDFNTKVDGKVEALREKHGYVEKLGNLETNKENLAFFKNAREADEATLAQYEEAIKEAKNEGDKETADAIKKALSSVKGKLEESKRVEKKIEQAINKLNKDIGKIDKKTDKWLGLKKKADGARRPEASPVSGSNFEENSSEVESLDDREQAERELERIEEVTNRLNDFMEHQRPTLPGDIERKIVDVSIQDLKEAGAGQGENENLDTSLQTLVEIKQRGKFAPQGAAASKYKLVQEAMKNEAERLHGYLEGLN